MIIIYLTLNNISKCCLNPNVETEGETNRISHHIEGGTRESHLSVQDLQSTTRLAEFWM